jgi:hypothetical protein
MVEKDFKTDVAIWTLLASKLSFNRVLWGGCNYEQGINAKK